MRTSPLSPDDIRAAAEVHQELGPEYNDAVVASFLEKVDREIAARVEARLAGVARAEPPKQNNRRTLVKGMAIGAATVALVVAVGAGRSGQSAPAHIHVAPRAHAGAPQVPAPVAP
jgi:NAD+--asparagine ADP-ribosyltransferase